jgi:surface antigen
MKTVDFLVMKHENRKASNLARLVVSALTGMMLSACAGDEASKPSVGSVAGAYFGAGVDDSLDLDDRRYMQRTAQNALEFNRTWETSMWRNPETDAEGMLTPTRTYESAAAKWCREFEATVTVDHEQELATGHACRERDGTWRIIEYKLGANRNR